MKSFVRFTQLLIVAAMLLVSCKSSSTVTPGGGPPTGTPTNPVLVNPPAPTIVPFATPTTEFKQQITIPPTSTVIDFLVDKSTSVDNDNCDKDQRRYEFVNFLVRDILGSVASPANDGGLYIGVSQFGEDVLPSYDFTNIEALNNFNLQPDKTGTSDTKYATGINLEITRMKLIETQKKILIILTDGQFASESIDEVDNALKGSVGDNLSVYIVLVCPRNIDSSVRNDWYGQFDGKMKGVRVFDALESAGFEVLNELQKYNFFPLDYLVVSIPQNEKIEIPGYAKSVSFSYWSVSGQSLNINLGSKPFITVSSNRPELSRDLKPSLDCGKQRFELPSISSPETGLLFVAYATFEKINLAIKFDSQESEILNNQPIIIKTVASGLDEADSFGSWRYCYDIQLISFSGGPITSQPCEGDSFKCLEDGYSAFRTDWLWTPPRFDTPQVVKFHAQLVSPKYGLKITDSDPVTANVKFQATNSVPVQLQYSENGEFPDNLLAREVTGIIPFEYVVSEPEIYLVSPKTNTEMKAVTDRLRSQNIPWMACPASTSNPNANFSGNSIVYLTDKYRNSLTLKQIYVKMRMPQPDAINPLKPTMYIFDAFSYVLSECGYNTIIFKWGDQLGVKASTWICEIENDVVSCNAQR
jgi:hypothetical protein